MIIEVDTPMEGCSKCKIFDLDTETIFAFGGVYSKVVKCRNADICRNAIELYTRAERKEE